MDLLRKNQRPAPKPGAWRVEPAPASKAKEAIALVVGAGRGGPDIAAGVAALQGYLTEELTANHDLWWAIENGRPIAAGLTVHSPGRTAVTLYSTTDTGLISVDPLAEVLATMSKHALAGDTTLVQALLSPGSRSDIQAFESAGFFLLAELIYMRQCLRGRVIRPNEAASAVTCLHYSEPMHAAFAEAILATYQDSLDCPALDGRRTIDDILAGHKAAGVFRPDLWTIAYVDGAPAGVMLMNQNATQNVAEIIYMGVAKAFRGRGIGDILLSKAAEMAVADRFGAISLAVDAGNRFAHRLYERDGFVEASRRLAYVRTADDPR